MQFRFVTDVPKYFDFPIFSKDLLGITELWVFLALYRVQTGSGAHRGFFTRG